MSDAGLLLAIGAISGTSMDGIDVALIQSDGEARVEPGPAATFPYPEAVAERLRAVVADPAAAAGPQPELERAVTDAHVEAVEAFRARFAIARESVVLAGLHGQTILHRPAAGVTRQLCDGLRAAAALKIDVVCDFRAADVAAGGEGAPFAPIYHAAMTAGLERPLMVLNWGGVGNVTWLGPDGEIVAFDTGPANALIDDFLLRRRGRRLRRRRPAGGERERRCGRARGDDARPLFRPAAAKVARSQPFRRRGRGRRAARRRRRRRDACGLHGRSDGGGAAAGARGAEALAGRGRGEAQCVPDARSRSSGSALPVEPVEAIGFDGDAIEAQCFAYLALRSRKGLPISFPGTTGVPAPMTGGVFCPAPA